MKVRALDYFEHNGPRKPHQIFDVSPQQGQQLARRGLVESLEGDRPLGVPAGAELPSSASQVDPASSEQTSNESVAGEEEASHKTRWQRRKR